MPLTWDSLLVAALAVELQRSLRHARLRAVHFDHEARQAHLFFREATLALDLHPERGTLVLGPPHPPTPGAHPLPCRVERVSAPPDDRVLLVEMRRRRGGGVPWLLAVELMTNQWNAVLAEGEERTVRALLRERSGDRPLGRGSPWLPPPPSPREGADGRLALERWLELLEGVEPERRRGVLLSRVAWTSTLDVEALLAPPGVAPGTLEALERGHALWTRLAETARGASEPVLLVRPGGPQPYPLALPGEASEPAASLLDALARAAETSVAGPAPGDGVIVPAAWTAAAEARVEHVRRRLGSLSRRLAGAPDPEALRAVGDLILARYAEVPPGRAWVTLRDFGEQPVEVELDPSLPPHENAAAYYQRAARARRARERIPTLLSEAREELARAEALLARVRAGALEPADAAALFPDLLTPDAGPRRSPLPYRRYRSSGGLEIRVGRSSKANDLLTFRHSAREDIWLHARHASGAHVILRWGGEDNPPARDLAEAAGLAALHSRARSSGSVPVDWTRRKHVRKPRGAAAGSVVPERVRTLFVEPDPALEERLRVEGGDEGNG